MLDILRMGLKLLEMKLESSKKFYEEITQKFKENKSILEKRYNEEEVSEESFEDIRDTLVDDYQEQEEFENLARMLVISHNYFVFEHILRSLIGHLQKQGKTVFKGDYKKMKMWKIKGSFKKMDIDFGRMEGFSDCNILGLLVNCIKHNGARVSQELAKAKGEILEEREIKEIKISRDEVCRYSDSIKLFYANLISRLDKIF